MFGSSKTLNVWVPYSTMANRLMGNNYFDSITVRIRDGYDSKEAEQQLSRLLTLRHGKKDFFTYNMDSLVQTAENHPHAAAVPDAGGGDFAGGRRYWRDEHHAGIGDRTHARDRHPHGGGCPFRRRVAAVPDRGGVGLPGGALGITLSFAIGLAVQLVLPGWQISFAGGVAERVPLFHRHRRGVRLPAGAQCRAAESDRCAGARVSKRHKMPVTAAGIFIAVRSMQRDAAGSV